MLNLIATTDLKRIVAESRYSVAHTNAFAKLSQLWNGSRRPKGSGGIRKVIGKRVGYPCVTRWNSFFDCVNELLQYTLEQLNAMLVATMTKTCQYKAFLQREITYLQEFAVLMQPLAISIDVLQGHDNNYHGQVIPILHSLREHYAEMARTSTFPFVKYAASKIILAMERPKRFRPQLFLEEPARLDIVAAASHPGFKLSWADEGSNMYATARRIFAEEVTDAMQKIRQQQFASQESQAPQSQAQPSTSSARMPHNIIPQLGPANFIIRRSAAGPQEDVQGQIVRFLEDPRTELSMLNAYPSIKEVFWRSNTPLCSTAPLERVFNFAGILNHPKRSRTTPENFNMSVVIKGNKVFQKSEAQRDPNSAGR